MYPVHQLGKCFGNYERHSHLAQPLFLNNVDIRTCAAIFKTFHIVIVSLILLACISQ